MDSRPARAHLEYVCVAVALITLACLSAAKTAAQSFDCRKAATDVEHAICGDRRLGKLDADVASEFERALESEPQQRQSLLADQRRWLAYRNGRCGVTSARNDCLSLVYRDRLRHLQSRSIPAAAICHRLADGDWARTSSRGGAAGEASEPPSPPLFVSAAALPSFGKPVVDLPEWAKTQNPSFVVGPKLMEALQTLDDGTIGHLGHVPGTNLYAITHEQGSAHCYVSQFFEVEAGHARPVATPPLLEDEPEASCYVARGYGRIEGMPAIVQRTLDVDPRMSSKRIVVTWDEAKVPSACVITTWHSPRFELESCEGPMCDDFRAAILNLVAAVQKSPRDTYDLLWSRLTSAQRSELDVAIDKAVAVRGLVPEARIPTVWEAEEITIAAPLFLPHLDAGRIYVAGIGHTTAYGKTLQGWTVEIESFQDGERTSVATYKVNMDHGDVQDISVGTSLR